MGLIIRTAVGRPSANDQILFLPLKIQYSALNVDFPIQNLLSDVVTRYTGRCCVSRTIWRIVAVVRTRRNHPLLPQNPKGVKSSNCGLTRPYALHHEFIAFYGTV